MKIEETLLVLVSAVLVVACGPNSSGGSSGAPASGSATSGPVSAASSIPVAASAAPSTSASAPTCAMNTQSADTCVVRKPGTPDECVACHLWAGGPPNQPFVYPYELLVPARPASSPVVLVWHLLDKGLRFPSAASGPTMPMPAASAASSPFSDPSPTSDDDGQTVDPDPDARMFRWKFQHPGAAQSYAYTMQFESRVPHTARFIPVSCDPTIKSSGN